MVGTPIRALLGTDGNLEPEEGIAVGSHSYSSRAAVQHGTRTTRGRHRKQSQRRIEPYSWLGAGAVALGVGAALASGSGVAHADDGASGGGTSSPKAQSPTKNVTPDKVAGGHAAKLSGSSARGSSAGPTKAATAKPATGTTASSSSPPAGTAGSAKAVPTAQAASSTQATVGSTNAAATTTSYEASAVYTGGQVVTVNGVAYKANWWTSGADPVTSNGAVGSGQPWTVVSSGSGSGTTDSGTTGSGTTGSGTTGSGTTGSGTGGSGTGGSGDVGEYTAGSVYTAGALVTVNGVTYKANWWTSGADPVISNGAVGSGQPWTVVSTGSGSTGSGSTGSGTENSGDISTYTPGSAYTAGALVTANGVTYKANWWTSGADPASNNGAVGSGQPWTLVGPTATAAPSAPINLAVSSVSSSTVSLSWSNGGGYAASYDVFQDGIKTSTVTGTSAFVSGLASSTSYTFTVEAVNSYGASPQSSPLSVTTAAQGSTAGYYFSPYVDMSLTAGQNVVSMAQQAGLDHVTLAFLQSSGSGSIGWGGSGSITNDQLSNGTSIKTVVQQLQSNNVDVTISFGGAVGVDPAVAATSAGQLQTQLQSVIDRYGVNSLDFDVEGSATANATANQIRGQALAALQAANPGLKISFTLPVLPTGLTSDGLNVLAAAKAAGATIDIVNIMAMDYGSAVDNGGDMGLSAILAVQSTEAQLDKIGLTTTKIGVTPMIGQNDVSTEVFTLADAQELVAYAATDPRVAELSMWSLARDNGSGAGAHWASPTSSGLTQTDYAFATTLGRHGQAASTIPTGTQL